MNKIILAAAVAVGVFGLTGCELTDAQKDAKKFQEYCAANQDKQIPECDTLKN